MLNAGYFKIFQIINIFSFLKKNSIKRVDFNNSGIPNYSQERSLISNFDNFTYKIKQFLFRKKYFLIFVKIFIIKNVYKYFIQNILNLEPEFLLISGKKNFCELKNTKVINGSSSDYSNYLTSKRKKFNQKYYNYAVYLADPGPDNKTDSNAFGEKSGYTIKNWYKSLNNFFSKIEKKLKVKIIIALHPKSKLVKKNKYLGNRICFMSKTLELVKFSNFVITQHSTAVSYAVIFKKPIISIYSNESKKIPDTIKYTKFLSKVLNSKLINIDNFKNKKFDKFYLKYNNNKYINFKKNYLNFRKDNKTNFELIEQIL